MRPTGSTLFFSHRKQVRHLVIALLIFLVEHMLTSRTGVRFPVLRLHHGGTSAVGTGHADRFAPARVLALRISAATEKEFTAL